MTLIKTSVTMSKKELFLCLCVFSLSFSVVFSRGNLRTLGEDTWSEMLDGEWMVEFYAPWCPACQHLQPQWKDFAEWDDDLNIKVGKVDVTVNPGLSGRFMLTALPTIYHIKDGVFRQYRGSRDKDAFISYVEERKWQNVEPVSSWKAPQSIQMSSVAFFFKASMLMRNIHSHLVEEVGIPYWASYILFGLSTIVVGTLLGLLFVCLIDFLCPSRMGNYQRINTRPEPAEVSPARPGGSVEDDSGFHGEDIIKEGTPKEENPADGDLRRRHVEPEED